MPPTAVLTRRFCTFTLAPLLVLGSCRMEGTDAARGQDVIQPPSAPSPRTDATAAGTGAILPAHERPRTPLVDVTTDFRQLPRTRSFERLTAEIVAAVERWHPAEAGGRPVTESAASETTGTVAVRRHGFPDDSVAGYEYVVMVSESGGEWSVASATRSTLCYRGVANELCA